MESVAVVGLVSVGAGKRTVATEESGTNCVSSSPEPTFF